MVVGPVTVEGLGGRRVSDILLSIFPLGRLLALTKLDL